MRRATGANFAANKKNRIMKKIKIECESVTLKEMIAYLLAILCIITAIVAIFISLFIPPEGEVHSSVLTYFGISSAFCGSLLGISAHFSNELTKFKSKTADSRQ